MIGAGLAAALAALAALAACATVPAPRVVMQLSVGAQTRIIGTRPADTADQPVGAGWVPIDLYWERRDIRGRILERHAVPDPRWILAETAGSDGRIIGGPVLKDEGLLEINVPSAPAEIVIFDAGNVEIGRVHLRRNSNAPLPAY